MRRILLQSIAISCALLALSGPAEARTRPRAGGRMRLELRQPSMAIDPASPLTSAEMRTQISPLVFETLTTTDRSGDVGPFLARSWTKLSPRRWSFTLRDGVQFSDGSDLDVQDVINSLAPLLPDCKIKSGGQRTVVIETPGDFAALAQVLSLPRFAIKRPSDQAPGGMLGTGPYQTESFQPGRSLLLMKNTGYWGPSSYIEQMTIAFTETRDTVVAPASSGDDAMQLTLEQARNVRSSGTVQVGQPPSLYAIVWLPKANVDERVKQALGLSISRELLATILGKDSAAPAYGYLPQQFSGYEFLLKSSPDVARARGLVRDSNWQAVIPVAFAANDPTAQLLAERIAVNGRDAGLNIQPYGEKDLQNAVNGSALALLVRVPLESAERMAALFSIASALHLDPAPAQNARSPEQFLAAERELLKDVNSLPLVHVATPVWTGIRLHDFSNTAPWHLETAWVESSVPQ